MRTAKEHIIYLSIRGLVLVLALYGFNRLYEEFLWKDDINKYDAHVLLDLMEGQNEAELVYLGESSNFSIHPEDTQRLSISELIDLQVEGDILTLNKGAYHAGLFYDLIKRIESSSVHTVIVTMNLRTLNQATIHAEIETALQQQDRFFKDRPALWNRLMLTLNFYDNTSYPERDKKMWHSWTYDSLTLEGYEFPAPTIKRWCELPKFLDSNGVEDMAKRTLADHYVKAYAFNITEDNPRIAQFDAIVDLCEERGYKLVFNLLAENVQYAQEYTGEALPALMKHNVAFLKDRYEAKGAIVVNNLELVDGIHYTDQHWTTEHYDEVGRQAIADQVAQALSEE